MTIRSSSANRTSTYSKRVRSVDVRNREKCVECVPPVRRLADVDVRREKIVYAPRRLVRGIRLAQSFQRPVLLKSDPMPSMSLVKRVFLRWKSTRHVLLTRHSATNHSVEKTHSRLIQTTGSQSF